MCLRSLWSRVVYHLSLLRTRGSTCFVRYERKNLRMATRTKPRNFSELDKRALEVRRRAIHETDLIGLEALAQVVCPSPEVLEASRLVAREQLERRGQWH